MENTNFQENIQNEFYENYPLDNVIL